jgi:hypothetical protein
MRRREFIAAFGSAAAWPALFRATLRADRENLGVGDGPTLSEQAK